MIFDRVASWLRALVAAEVAKVQTSLQNERDLLQSHFEMVDEVVKAQLSTIEKALTQVVEENATLKTKVHELQHNRWVASPEAVAADHALRMVK